MAELMWRQNNGVPRLLKPMEYDENGLSWTGVATSEAAQLALHLVAAPYPEYNADEEEPVWNEANEEWDIVPRVIVTNWKVTKSDFSRLFTFQERIDLEAFEQQANAADLTDPMQALVFGPVKVMFRSFGLPAEFIELDHPETIAAVSQILVGGNVITTERAERILSNLPPLVP